MLCNNGQLPEHLELVHKGKKPIKCNECDASFSQNFLRFNLAANKKLDEFAHGAMNYNEVLKTAQNYPILQSVHEGKKQYFNIRKT